MRISDWSSDVCSSDLSTPPSLASRMPKSAANFTSGGASSIRTSSGKRSALDSGRPLSSLMSAGKTTLAVTAGVNGRSEEHTSELQSLMRISYAVFCLKKKQQKKTPHNHTVKDKN